MAILQFACASKAFASHSDSHVRWLAPQADFYRYEQMLLTRGVSPPAYSEWLQWHEQGYGFAAYVVNGIALSVGVVMRQPEGSWQVAGIRTLEQHQRNGYASAVTSFLTAYIVNERGTAECEADADNTAMITILERLGYTRIGFE